MFFHCRVFLLCPFRVYLVTFDVRSALTSYYTFELEALTRNSFLLKNSIKLKNLFILKNLIILKNSFIKDAFTGR